MAEDKPKMSFRRKFARGLAVAGAVFLFMWFLSWLATPRLQKYIIKSRDSAAQNLLQQLALAQTAYAMDNDGDYAADWTALVVYGYRPDPNVRVVMFTIDLGRGESRLRGFLARANHAVKGSGVYIYNNITGHGVAPLPKAKPLGDEYAVTVVEDARRSGEESSGQAAVGPMILKGPPIVAVRVPWREPVR